MKQGKTGRGFSIVEFKDKYDADCSIQKSSLTTEDCIWLGITDADPKIMASKVREDLKGWVKYPIPEDVLLSTRMHLNREQVAELLPILQNFVDTGEVSVPEELPLKKEKRCPGCGGPVRQVFSSTRGIMYQCGAIDSACTSACTRTYHPSECAPKLKNLIDHPSGRNAYPYKVSNPGTVIRNGKVKRRKIFTPRRFRG